MHALGSLDYLWHALIPDWDIPLDIPLNASLTSLSNNYLRLAAVKSLKLDHRWRNPRIEMRRAQCIISRNSSFVDSMRFLPGGRWLVTLQHEPRSKTHVTLWSIADSNEQDSVFDVTVVGRVRFFHAHHHHELEQITIGIAIARGTEETIRVYHVFLPGDSSTRHSLVFEARPGELHPMGRIVGMKINGDTMIAVFEPQSLSSEQQRGQIACVNLISKAAAVLDCPDWACMGRIKIFSRYFAVATSRWTAQPATACVSFYELPSVTLDHPDCLSPTVPRWPEKQAVKSSLIASTSWNSDDPLVYELSDDAPTNNTTTCSCTMFGYSIPTQRLDVENLIEMVHVSFDGKSIERTLSVVPCRFIPSDGEIRVSSSGKRAVWLTQDPDTHEFALMKFALGRGTAKGTGSCISTLMPSFSGLPLNPRDFHSFVFDEISCKMAVGLPTGELYILHYD
ncbi:hypothetical protein L210DRAFT_3644474 [Boletus edulis BED1]|uniref:Uncharacterized protein n=1 Tax=Boletus edulis BED1 TaxID=1328754 RepID=A0AAD4BY46_BOLED|nr:hypothetical protein L210DRAFT_3644474 [Boletus edulis BED1]